MSPGTLNFTIYAGTNFGPLVFNLFSDQAQTMPFVLAGWLPRAQIRVDPARSLVVDLQPEITDSDNGEVQITLTKTQTAALCPGNYHWDFLLEEDVTGNRFGPYVAGRVTVEKAITQ